jgi:hypothetical protein
MALSTTNYADKRIVEYNETQWRNAYCADKRIELSTTNYADKRIELSTTNYADKGIKTLQKVLVLEAIEGHALT